MYNGSGDFKGNLCALRFFHLLFEDPPLINTILVASAHQNGVTLYHRHILKMYRLSTNLWLFSVCSFLQNFYLRTVTGYRPRMSHGPRKSQLNLLISGVYFELKSERQFMNHDAASLSHNRLEINAACQVLAPWTGQKLAPVKLSSLYEKICQGKSAMPKIDLM